MTLWVAESPFRASSVLPVVTNCKLKKLVFSNFFVFSVFFIFIWYGNRSPPYNAYYLICLNVDKSKV